MLLLLKLFYILQKLFLFVSLTNNYGKANTPLIKATPQGYPETSDGEGREHVKKAANDLDRLRIRLGYYQSD